MSNLGQTTSASPVMFDKADKAKLDKTLTTVKSEI